MDEVEGCVKRGGGGEEEDRLKERQWEEMKGLAEWIKEYGFSLEG